MNFLSSKPATTNKGLHITVGVSPSGELDVSHEVQIVKSALLYADKVKLISFTTFALYGMVVLGRFDHEQQIEFLQSLIPSLSESEYESKETLRKFNKYKLFRKRKNHSGYEKKYIAQIERELNKQWKEVEAIAIEQAIKAGAGELLEPLNKGLLEIHPFQTDDLDKMAHEYYDSLMKSISDGSTFPLFDTKSGDLVRASLQEGLFTVPDVDKMRSKHCALAANLFERLPLFESASIGEILDIRSELQKPLHNFRSAMIKMSDDMKSCSWEEDFVKEAELIFYENVKPSVLEIEEAVRSNKSLTKYIKCTVKPLELAKNSSLALVLSLI